MQRRSAVRRHTGIREKNEMRGYMKNTTDYMVGNTAFQIINKGKKIIVVDVEKEKARKQFIRKSILTLAAGFVVFLICLGFVHLENNRVLLDRQLYEMREEVSEMEGELQVLEKESEQKEVDFADIFHKAKKMGMRFPQLRQVCYYKADKSTAVRINVKRVN